MEKRKGGAMVDNLTGELKALAAARKAVAAAMKKAEGVVKGYLAVFDQLQRVSVKTPSGGSRKTAADLEKAKDTAQVLDTVLSGLDGKVQAVVQGMMDAVDPLNGLNLSHVDRELEALAEKSATLGGAMAGAVTVAAEKYHQVANTLHTATDAYASLAEDRLSRFAQYVQSQVLAPVEGGFTGLAQRIGSAMGGAVDAVEASLTAVTAAVRKMNSLSFTVGGKTFSLAPGKAISLPGLANGAVLPANQPFLAVVGDQKRGTNVEAPLSTIQEAVAQVMDGYAAAELAGQEATVAVLRDILQAVLGIELGDGVLADAVRRHNSKMAVVRGV